MSDYALFINGVSVPGAAEFNVINPATEDVISSCPRADLSQLEQAVAAASAAFPAWAALAVESRREHIFGFADHIEDSREQIARVLTAEAGKPLADALAEVAGAVALIRALSSIEVPVESLQSSPGGKVIRHHSPLGVVAAIIPWNSPIALMALKVASALITGNTVIVKPAPTTPLSSLLLAAIAGPRLPPGVFNVITDQHDLAPLLTTHPGVAKVSFTGSITTGAKVAQASAASLKRFTLELGGNDAAIVLDDVSVADVARKIFQSAMMNSGQICFATKRVYVPGSIYDEFCLELKSLAERATMGDGMEQGTEYGPLQNQEQFNKALFYLDIAKRDGRIIAGGNAPRQRGYFIEPTIVRDIDDESPIVRDEQFCPILPVLKYERIDDAVARANDSKYALGGSVWSGDPRKGLEVAKALQAGTIWVNQHMVIDPAISTGGNRSSGFGRELGLEGLAEFTQSHTILVAER